MSVCFGGALFFTSSFPFVEVGCCGCCPVLEELPAFAGGSPTFAAELGLECSPALEEEPALVVDVPALEEEPTLVDDSPALDVDSVFFDEVRPVLSSLDLEADPGLDFEEWYLVD